MAKRGWFHRIFGAGSESRQRMRTFVIQLRNGDRIRVRARHLWHHEASIDLMIWDEEFRDNRSVASFPLVDVAMIYAEETVDTHSSRKFVAIAEDDL